MSTKTARAGHRAAMRVTTDLLPAMPVEGEGAGRLVFVRHGVTEHNLKGLRCGGDLDVPLADVGREQALRAAMRIRKYGLPVGLIVTAALSRTRETGDIIAAHLGATPIIEEPLFNERRLGEWNGLPQTETEAALRAGVTPPGGEPADAFAVRVATALDRIRPLLSQQLLVVSSAGVGRVINEIVQGISRFDVGNAEIFVFDVGAMPAPVASCHARGDAPIPVLIPGQ